MGPGVMKMEIFITTAIGRRTATAAGTAMTATIRRGAAIDRARI
jgi:hypothetical protein